MILKSYENKLAIPVWWVMVLIAHSLTPFLTNSIYNDNLTFRCITNDVDHYRLHGNKYHYQAR